MLFIIAFRFLKFYYKLPYYIQNEYYVAIFCHLTTLPVSLSPLCCLQTTESKEFQVLPVANQQKTLFYQLLDSKLLLLSL